MSVIFVRMQRNRAVSTNFSQEFHTKNFTKISVVGVTLFYAEEQKTEGQTVG